MEATRVFNQPRLEEVDTRENYGEERINAIGVGKDRLLNVTYTELPDGNTHIISARKVENFERELFREYMKEQNIAPPPDQRQRERDRGTDDDWMP